MDADFPREMLPGAVGLIVADGLEAELLRAAPDTRLTPPRRRVLLHRFALLAAGRLAAADDPAGAAGLRAALRVD